MMKEAVRMLETGPLAEIGVVAFMIAFVLIVLYALTLPKDTRERAKRLPLDDYETPSLHTNGKP